MASFNPLCCNCLRLFQVEGILREYLILCLVCVIAFIFGRGKAVYLVSTRSCQFQVFGEQLIGLYLSFSKPRSLTFLLLTSIVSN